jgi:DNA polymerase alpha-associated DNA helicase A
MTATSDDLTRFISRQKELLLRERTEEIARTSLLLSNNAVWLWEVSVSRRWASAWEAKRLCGHISVRFGNLTSNRLIELERPSAYHTTPVFPPHTFRQVQDRLGRCKTPLTSSEGRPGDLARIEENQAATGMAKKPIKSKKMDATSSTSVEGVVYKVCPVSLFSHSCWKSLQLLDSRCSNCRCCRSIEARRG